MPGGADDAGGRHDTCWRLNDSKLNRLVNGNLSLFSAGEEREQLCTLASGPSDYLCRWWPPPGRKDDAKRALVAAAAAGAAPEELEEQRLALLEEPAAAARPKQLEAHGDVRTDDFYWLRDDGRRNTQVRQYLEAENAYCNAAMADTDALQEQLYDEMRAAVQEADASAPVRSGGYWYYSKTLKGKQHEVHCRRKVPAGAPLPGEEGDAMDESMQEEVVLDENKEAKKHPFYATPAFYELPPYEVSPNSKLVAWGEDVSGAEKFGLRLRDLSAGRELLAAAGRQRSTSGQLAWAADSRSLFYAVKDELDRPHQVWRHTVGTKPAADVCVYDETDEAFHLTQLTASRSGELILLTSATYATSEVRFLRASEPRGEWTVVRPRQQGTRYIDVCHRGDHLFILVQDAARPNRELLVAPLSDPAATRVLLPHSEDVCIERLEASQGFLALQQRSCTDVLHRCVVHRLPADGGAPAELGLGTAVPLEDELESYELLIDDDQGDFVSPLLRLLYTSMATPRRSIDYHQETGQCLTRHVEPCPGYVPGAYTTRRLWATAPDGVRVPISLLYRTDLVKLDGSDPLLFDGYGSYGLSNDPDFQAIRLPLLNRGVICALGHMRGGAELGQRWYEAGKFMQKRNTFSDFVACAEHLIAQKFTCPRKLAIQGMSAGGLLMGAAINARPDLFCAAIVAVPFVDVLTTMLDEGIAQTVREWDEWGDPRDPQQYAYMKSYSPLDNLRAAAYPHMLVTAGLWDPQVGFWEPAKYTAALRRLRTNGPSAGAGAGAGPGSASQGPPERGAMLLFDTEFDAGHFSKSGRFEQLVGEAFGAAFLLKSLGMLRAPAVPPPGATAGAAAAASR